MKKRRSGSFVFPHYDVPSRTVQPDYAKWQSVVLGMTRDQVIALLGRPLKDPYSAPKPRKADPYYHYGYLQMPMMPYVRTYRFYVGFNDQGMVFTKADPFGGIFSSDGKPSKPRIFTPPDGSVFRHYPWVLDMRWNPVSGKYPMRYEVEFGASLDMAGPFSSQVLESELPFPYCVMNHCGPQPGRFRVRGRNKLGVGEWSDYCYFDFSPLTGARAEPDPAGHRQRR
jgi:hypothetical protein